MVEFVTIPIRGVLHGLGGGLWGLEGRDRLQIELLDDLVLDAELSTLGVLDL